MDSNNLYQSQPTGTEPDNNNQETYQNNDAYQNDGAYQQAGYNQYDQNGGYNNSGNYNNGNYGNYNAGNYSNGNYGNGSYNNNAYGNNNYSNGNYNNGGYGGNYNGSYGNGGYQTPYQQSQLDLEEPVKMSEWLISMLLMMVPCLNLVMMFVWAFSKTEKKSKSNFFKAYLIIFGIIFALYLVIVILIAAGVFGSLYY